jgi:hypothetical protein
MKPPIVIVSNVTQIGMRLPVAQFVANSGTGCSAVFSLRWNSVLHEVVRRPMAKVRILTPVNQGRSGSGG